MEAIMTERERLEGFEHRAWEAFGRIVEVRDALHDLLDEAAELEDAIADDGLSDRLAAERSHIDLAHDALWLAYNIFDEVGV